MGHIPFDRIFLIDQKVNLGEYGCSTGNKILRKRNHRITDQLFYLLFRLCKILKFTKTPHTPPQHGAKA